MNTHFKKTLPLILVFFMLLSLFIPVIANASREITIIANGEAVDFKRQNPIIKNSRTLVPVRNVFEQLGFKVSWSQKTKTVTLVDRNNHVSIKVGEFFFQVNSKDVFTDVPAEIINGSTMLPLRSIGEALDSDIDWNQKTKTASINYSGKKSILPNRNITYYPELDGAVDFGIYFNKNIILKESDSQNLLSNTANYVYYTYENTTISQVNEYYHLLLKEGFIDITDVLYKDFSEYINSIDEEIDKTQKINVITLLDDIGTNGIIIMFFEEQNIVSIGTMVIE